MTVTVGVVMVAAAAAVLVFLLSAMRGLPDPIDPVPEERVVVRWLDRHPRLRRFLRERLDRRTAGGVIVTTALVIMFIVAGLVGVILDMVDDSSGLASLDDGVSQWGTANADSVAVDILTVITYLGDTVVVVGALLAVGLVDFLRRRRVGVFAFLATVIVGEKLIVNGSKRSSTAAVPMSCRWLAGKARPSRRATRRQRRRRGRQSHWC